MPGIFAQTIAFASATTAIGMTDDIGKGLIDRFRSLPMARSAVLTGRTVADIIYQAGILVVLMLAGLVVGWPVNNGLGAVPAGGGAAAQLRVRDVLDRRLDRPVRAEHRDRAAIDVRHDLPVHVHLQRVRPRSESLPPAPATDRGVEPGEHLDGIDLGICSATRTPMWETGSRASTRFW